MKSLWVKSGPGIPCGARKLGHELLGPPPQSMEWLDVCILGQHLPQMYPLEEIRELTAGQAELLGLCGHCKGQGDLDDPTLFDALARGVDEIGTPCPGCGGTGRPCLRVSVRRSQASIESTLTILPHAYITPPPGEEEERMAFEAPPDMCLACGMPEDGRGLRGEAVHKS